MPGINKVLLVGQLASHVNLGVDENDCAIAKFSLVTVEKVVKNGEKTEQAEWHHIVMGRSTAESAAKVLYKGRVVYLEGKARTRTFEDQAGIKRYVTEVIADSFRLIGINNDLGQKSGTGGLHEEKR